MTLKAMGFISPPKERAQIKKGRERGGVGQSPAKTQEKSSPGGRASSSNFEEVANGTGNTENAMFQNLREENVARQGR